MIREIKNVIEKYNNQIMKARPNTKSVYVRPLLKKPDLDQNTLKFKTIELYQIYPLYLRFLKRW